MKKSLLFITFIFVIFIGRTIANCQLEAAYLSLQIKEDKNPDTYESDYYYLYLKTENRPAVAKLVRELKINYPDTKLDWSSALTRKKPRFDGDSYHYFSNSPFEWIVTYPHNNIPELSTHKQKMDWLKKQNKLMEIISKTKIPLDSFKWQFKSIMKSTKDGRMVPAILVKANSLVLCILKSKIVS